MSISHQLVGHHEVTEVVRVELRFEAIRRLPFGHAITPALAMITCGRRRCGEF